MNIYIAHNRFYPLRYIVERSTLPNVHYIDLLLKRRSHLQWLLCLLHLQRFFPHAFMEDEAAEQLRSIDAGDRLIIIDNKHATHLSAINSLVHPKAERHLFFWTPIKHSYLKHSFKTICHRVTSKARLFTLSTFDPDDVRYYKDLIVRREFFFSPSSEEYDEAHCHITSDCYFLGNDKGRSTELLDLKQKLEEKGLRTDFLIVNHQSASISYDDNIERMKHCRCLVDYVHGQSGLSLRPLEALFYGKKLITNNTAVKKHPFYNPQNIFILGEDNWDDIIDFVRTPCAEISEDIKRMYHIDTWIKDFA